MCPEIVTTDDSNKHTPHRKIPEIYGEPCQTHYQNIPINRQKSCIMANITNNPSTPKIHV